MGRRSDHSREELYEMALSQARQLVLRDGWRGLTARNVADAMGYSPGTLYNLFANLDDLILHLNARTLDDLYDGLTTLSLAGEPRADLKLILDCYLTFIEQHAALWSNLFDFTLPAGQQAPDWYGLKIQRMLALVEGVLAPLFDPNEDAARKNAARTLWAGLHGITTLAQTGKLAIVTDQSMREMAEQLVRYVLCGLTQEKTEGR